MTMAAIGDNVDADQALAMWGMAHHRTMTLEEKSAEARLRRQAAKFGLRLHKVPWPMMPQPGVPAYQLLYRGSGVPALLTDNETATFEEVERELASFERLEEKRRDRVRGMSSEMMAAMRWPDWSAAKGGAYYVPDGPEGVDWQEVLAVLHVREVPWCESMESLPRDNHGMAVPGRRTFWLDPASGHNPYTFLHELAHCVLGKTPGRGRDWRRRRTGPFGPYPLAEYEADMVAMFVAAPLDLLNPDWPPVWAWQTIIDEGDLELRPETTGRIRRAADKILQAACGLSLEEALSQLQALR